MSRFVWIVAGIALVILVVIGVGLGSILMPGSWDRPKLSKGYTGLVPAEALLRVPVSGIYPGGNSRGLNPDMENPLKDDPDAVVRGMHDFDNFNCSGCHMPNGGGGMGPALSDHVWFHRGSPANLYLDIAQGRSNGMPAFGAMLPDRTIWELVAYIQSLSSGPERSFGVTTSATGPAPPEQVPAGQAKLPAPWSATEPTPSNGERDGAGSAPPDAPLPPGAEQAKPAETVVSQ